MHDKLPHIFRPILWSYDFNRIDPLKDRRTMVIEAVNYGTLGYWRWLNEHYGRGGVRQVLSAVPATELRPRARRLAALVFGIDQFNYAPRSTH